MVAEKVAQLLLDASAVKIQIDPPFTWTSGIKSPIYCDNRALIGLVESRTYIVDEFVKLVEPLKPDVIAGTATAAIPWASFLAQKLSLPLVYVRPEPKAHGAGKQIEGLLEPGSKVVLIEDLFSTGGSSVKSALAIRNEGGCTCDHIFGIVTYGFEKAQKAFRENGLESHVLTNFEAIVAEAVKRGVISADDKKVVMDFASDPEGWAGKLKN
jgi:orotate phosphoribosyltransferase